MFIYEPSLSQFLDPKISQQVRQDVGDIRQPWVGLGATVGISPFAAKALFALGMMRRYILSANAILKDLRHLGFLSACALFGSAVELLGRCIHQNKIVRQDPISNSMKRLQAGFDFIKRPHLPLGVIVATNHYPVQKGGYSVQDLINLRNLAAHGGSLSRATQIKGDIELLHELRKALYGIPFNEEDPNEGHGPVSGATDRYYELLATGNRAMCDRLATSGISPIPVRFQGTTWPFDTIIIAEIKQLIEENVKLGYYPISGGHSKANDYFQLYP